MGAPPLLLSGRLGYKGKRSVIANVPRDVTSPVCLLNGARFSTGPFSKGAPLPGAPCISDHDSSRQTKPILSQGWGPYLARPRAVHSVFEAVQTH